MPGCLDAWRGHRRMPDSFCVPLRFLPMPATRSPLRGRRVCRRTRPVLAMRRRRSDHPWVSSRSSLERKSGDPERGRALRAKWESQAALLIATQPPSSGIRARFRLSGPTVGASEHDTWGTHGDCPFGMLLLSRCSAGRASHSLGESLRSGERRQGTSGGPALRVHLHLPARRTFQRKYWAVEGGGSWITGSVPAVPPSAGSFHWARHTRWRRAGD
jgi:hypothetical protein